MHSADKKITFLDQAIGNNNDNSCELIVIHVADYSLNEQAEVVLFDPKVTEEQIFSDLDYLGSRSGDVNRRAVTVVESELETGEKCHAIAVPTERDEFQNLDWKDVYCKMLKPAILFYGRRLLEPRTKKEIVFGFYAIKN